MYHPSKRTLLARHMSHPVDLTVSNDLFDQQARSLAVLPKPFLWVDQVLASVAAAKPLGKIEVKLLMP
jgi:hypothetical protein